MTRNYVNISLPTPLIAAVDELIKVTPMGFVSRCEVLKHVLREYMMELIRTGVLKPEQLHKIKVHGWK